MAKTAAEKQKAYRDKKRIKEVNDLARELRGNAPGVTGAIPIAVLAEVDRACGDKLDHGPLSVYSPARWAVLEELGYAWKEDKNRAYTYPGDAEAVPRPGDPAYQGVAV